MTRSWMTISAVIVMRVAVGGSLVEAQNAQPQLLGETLEAPAGAAAAPTRDREHPFEVWSLGRVAPRNPRAAAIVVAPPAEPREPEPREAIASPAGVPATPAAPATASASAPPPPASAARPATASTPAAVSSGTRTHRVEWGETWLGIARQYRVSDSSLRAANPGVDPERIRSGQVLRIPAGATAAQRVHHVIAGETLSGIARRYGVSSEAIRRANRLNDDLIRTGQTLVIPGS